jgi:hypothetical protein
MLWTFFSHFLVVTFPARLILRLIKDTSHHRHNFIIDINLSYDCGNTFGPDMVIFMRTKLYYLNLTLYLPCNF